MDLHVAIVNDIEQIRKDHEQALRTVVLSPFDGKELTYQFHQIAPDYSPGYPRRLDTTGTLRKILEVHPAIAIVDLKLEGVALDDYSGAVLFMKLSEARPDCKVILVSHHFEAAPEIADLYEEFHHWVDLNQRSGIDALRQRFAEATRQYIRLTAFRARHVSPAPLNAPHPQRAVYVSYAWDQPGLEAAGSPNLSAIVDAVEESLKRHGYDFRRDRNCIPYAQSIFEFMKALGQSRCAITVLSDKYFRSHHCMYELTPINRNPDGIYKRVCPIRLPSVELGDERQLAYAIYWQNKGKELSRLLKKIDIHHQSLEQFTRIKVILEIAKAAGTVIPLVASLNAESLERLAENDYELLRSRIDECIDSA